MWSGWVCAHQGVKQDGEEPKAEGVNPHSLSADDERSRADRMTANARACRGPVSCRARSQAGSWNSKALPHAPDLDKGVGCPREQLWGFQEVQGSLVQRLPSSRDV